MNDKVTLGLYAGSFNPFTVGHLDIVKQAMDIFEEVVVAQGYNPSKYPNFYPLPSNFLKSLNAGISTRVFSTLLTDLIKELENDYYNVILVRGLRNGADLEYEQNLTAFLRDMHPTLKSVAFYCDPKFRHISSSALRDIKKFSEIEYKKYVITD